MGLKLVWARVRGRETALVVLAGLVGACAPPGSGVGSGGQDPPGLHTMMVELAMRHASLWFAGEAENWPLADYMMHELEEVAARIPEVHAEYDGIPVASLLTQMMTPAVEATAAAVDAGDREAFVAAYDQLTTSCNACHAASDRGAIVIQRPTSPPLTNVRYAP